MSVARWVESVFMGRDMRGEMDRLIAEEKAKSRNAVQAVHSGARIVQHMSGVMQLVAENHAE